MQEKDNSVKDLLECIFNMDFIKSQFEVKDDDMQPMEDE